VQVDTRTLNDRQHATFERHRGIRGALEGHLGGACGAGSLVLG
jgi:hypothetical protein